MRTSRAPRVGAVLGLILLLATAARVPGLFWGYHVFGSDTVVLHPEEASHTLGNGPGAPYPRGLETHVRVLALVLRSAGLADRVRGAEWDFFAGRLLSLLYGLLTVVVLFRLARSLSGDATIGLLAALFLALADLHVTYSHLGLPDSAATFWFYAALASGHTALARGSRRAALLSAVCTGAAAALRLQPMSLIPLVWWVARSRRRLLNGVLLALAVVGAFSLVHGLAVSPGGAFSRLLNAVGWEGPGFERLLLPFVYLAVIVVGAGLPIVLLAGYGVLRFVRAKWQALGTWRDVVADNQIPIVLAVAATFLQLAAVPLWAPRHAVVLIPSVAMLAAYGFAELPRLALGPLSAPVAARGLLALIGLYLALQVASVQAYFVDEPLEKAGRWLRAHVPAGEFVSTSGARVPPEYPTIAEWKANYLVLSARRYRHALDGPGIASRLMGRLPGADDVRPGYPRDALQAQKLARGELGYRLVRKIRLRFHTPELLIARALGASPPHLDEVLIYERRREPERVVALLTPSRTDYLVTLDTGAQWGLLSGQQVRISLNDRPLAVRLKPGINHLLLPRASVTAPHSRLRLSSDLPLPHLPLGFTKRIRPLGREFVVESLLDEDLMPEGFFEPEVRADGATWRWTAGAGEVLLPGSGSSGPWRRLAVRLRGRPSGAPSPQTVVWFLDSKKVGEVALSGEERTVEFPIPAGALQGELGALEVVASTGPPAAVPGSGETRRVGVAVYWVRLTRAERFPPREGRAESAAGGNSWRPLFGLGVPYRIEGVSFPSGGLTLKGDLFVPLGGGKSVILLAHGASPLGRKHGLYPALARRFAEKGYRVLSPDFRGYGESERPPRIASARDVDFPVDLASAITFLEKRLGVREVTVVGHSFGADVGIALAARDPRVRRLVAISPARRVFGRYLSSPEGRQGLRDRMAFEMGLAAEQVPLELMESIIVPITIDTYVDHPFRQPLLLLDGGGEAEADRRFLSDIYRRMKAAKAYLTIPNADHYFGIQRQVEERDPVTLDALADVIDGWIREGADWIRADD